MSHVIIASNEQDAAIGPRIRDKHAELIGGLTVRLDAVIRAVESGRAPDMQELTAYTGHIRSHLSHGDRLAQAARTLPDAAAVAGVVDGNQQSVLEQIDAVTAATSAVRAVSAGGKLLSALTTHTSVVDEYLIPALAASSDIDLAELAGDDSELAGGSPESRASGGHVCECGVVDEPELPELDARSVPHSIRHATIFGALDAVEPGSGMILVAPHDPLPLLDQLEARSPGQFAIDYVKRGPEKWRLQFVRVQS